MQAVSHVASVLNPHMYQTALVFIFSYLQMCKSNPVIQTLMLYLDLVCHLAWLYKPRYIYIHTAKLHFIKPQGTGVNGSIYPRFEISHIHLFALIVARPFIIGR